MAPSHSTGVSKCILTSQAMPYEISLLIIYHFIARLSLGRISTLNARALSNVRDNGLSSTLDGQENLEEKKGR